MAEHLAEFLGSVASAVALGFIAYAASIQARQARSQELLTSFQLSRPDLGGLARRIAMTARLVVDEHKGGAPGKLTEYQAAYELGDHAVFAYLISSPKRIQAALTGSDGEQLRHQTLRYIRLFDSVTALTQERELERMLLRLPLGRAYCTLKIAIGEDGDGRLANCLAFDAEPELGRP